MMKVQTNRTALAVIALCLAVWASVALSGLKLGYVYEHRGAHGFRQALLMRVEHRLGLHPYETEGRDG
jgi:hypothetical protein